MAYLIRRGYGNSIDISLVDSDINIDFNSINRAVFDVGDYQLDSDNSDYINIVSSTNSLNEPIIIVKIQPGLEDSIPAGDYRGELTVYDDNILKDGFVWIKEIEVILSDKTDLEWEPDGYTIDHGNLGGLTDDDHPQYLTISSADSRYLTDASQVFPEQIGHSGEYLTTDGITPYWNAVVGGGGGVTDHGALTGLADDDHSQYHTDSRGDARYSALGHTHAYDPAGTASAAVTAHEGAADPHPTYLTATEGNAAYSALGHNHSGVYDPAGTASAAITAHESAVDPHPTYLTSTEGNAAYSALGHNHDATYAPLAKGVTNGDSHDHSGGDGAQISYSTLSNIPSSFTPAAHATSHKSGGNDSIKLDELASPTDVTTLNASDSAHGLLPKLANTGTKYLRDDGTWQTVSGGSATQAFGTISVSGQSDVVADAAPDTLTLVASTNIQITTNSTDDSITIAASHNHDSAYAAIGNGVTNGDSHDHNGGDGAQISYANLSNIPSSFTPAAHATSHKSAGSDSIKLDELAAPTDVTTLNASSSAHGLLPKLDNTSTKYLRDDGTWQTVSASPDSHTIFIQALQLGAML